MLKDWLEAVIEVVLILLILFFLFWPVQVQGVSMEKTFFNNDRLILTRLINNFEKDDVIVISIQEEESFDIIKRVVAVAGDTVEIIDGSLFVNGKKESNTYSLGNTYYKDDISVTIPKNHYFVLGDNREYSTDSRNFGTVEKEQIVGKIIMKILPINQFEVYF